MPVNPVEDLTITQNAAGDSLATLEWTHPGTGTAVDRWMLGYKRDEDDEWTNLEPVLKATYGTGPYEAEVPLSPSIEWRVVAVAADGTHS